MLFPLMANETEASEIPRRGGCAWPEPHSFCNCLGQAEHPKWGHLRLPVGNLGSHTYRQIYLFPLPGHSITYRMSSLTASKGERLPLTKVRIPSAQ